MKKTKKVAIICGGKSAEHEISLISAMNILAAINREEFEPLIIGINKKGAWFWLDEKVFLDQEMNPKTVKIPENMPLLALTPGNPDSAFVQLETGKQLGKIEVVFAILHGPFGEDGTAQGLFEQLNLPYVGPGVLGSAAGMDKVVFKKLMNDAGIISARSLDYRVEDQSAIDFEYVQQKLGNPLFLKPARMGSSVGISKVRTQEEFEKGIKEAFKYDTKVLIEECIVGREIECAVLGNNNLRASIPGEIIPVDDFYTYEAKYIKEKGAVLEAPAKNLSKTQIQEIQEKAIAVFKACDCEGLGRVDFFLTEDGRLLINEINTLPGFTKISMFPRLWGLSGIPYDQLISELLHLAIQRHERKTHLS